MSSFTFQLTRGDTAPIGGTVTQTTNGVTAPYPIQDTDVVRFAAKRHFGDSDDDALFLLSTPTRIAILDGPNGLISFSITPADWAIAFPDPIRKPVSLVADLQVSSSAGTQVFTLATGQLLINPDVTITAP